MNKYEFITNLQRHLTGKVSAEKLKELTDYYNDYIDSQIRKGRTEDEVLKELGDPRLLAKSIVETEGSGRTGGGFAGVYEESGQGEGNGSGGSFRARRIAFRIILLLVLFLILYIIFGIIGLALNIFLRFVLPILIPVLVLYGIVRIFRR